MHISTLFYYAWAKTIICQCTYLDYNNKESEFEHSGSTCQREKGNLRYFCFVDTVMLATRKCAAGQIWPAGQGLGPLLYEEGTMPTRKKTTWAINGILGTENAGRDFLSMHDHILFLCTVITMTRPNLVLLPSIDKTKVFAAAVYCVLRGLPANASCGCGEPIAGDVLNTDGG